MLNICINFWVNLPVHVSTVVKKSKLRFIFNRNTVYMYNYAYIN